MKFSCRAPCSMPPKPWSPAGYTTPSTSDLQSPEVPLLEALTPQLDMSPATSDPQNSKLSLSEAPACSRWPAWHTMPRPQFILALGTSSGPWWRQSFLARFYILLGLQQFTFTVGMLKQRSRIVIPCFN